MLQPQFFFVHFFTSNSYFVHLSQKFLYTDDIGRFLIVRSIETTFFRGFNNPTVVFPKLCTIVFGDRLLYNVLLTYGFTVIVVFLIR